MHIFIKHYTYKYVLALRLLQSATDLHPSTLIALLPLCFIFKASTLTGCKWQ